MKIVINQCYGGFSLSFAGVKLYFEKNGWDLFAYTSKYSDGQSTFTLLDNNVDNNEFLIHYYKSPRIENEDDTEDDYFSVYKLERNDPTLIEVVNELGDKANGSCAKLGIVEIPDDVKWTIEEYDGIEWVAEVHRTWN